MGSYAADISAAEAWDVLSHDLKALLVDVRTQPEWQFAGVADLSSIGKQVVTLSLNDNFPIALEKLNLKDDNKILFICKTGGRSSTAASLAANLGLKNSYNIKDGMEGPQNAAGQRGKIAGWKAANLPWRQD